MADITHRSYRSPAYEQMRAGGLAAFLQGMRSADQAASVDASRESQAANLAETTRHHKAMESQDKAQQQGPREAQNLTKHLTQEYKGVSDQLDAAKGTLDALNQGNAISDKIALINEARIAAGAGGSRAIKSLIDVLSGGVTAKSTYQEAINWLENTPNIPTLQPAQRNAIRESVYGRLPQLEDQFKQISTSLGAKAHLLAPHTDYKTILQSSNQPMLDRISSLHKMQDEYNARRAQLPGGPTSYPSVADANVSMLDKAKDALSSFFSRKSQPLPAPSPTPTGVPMGPPPPASSVGSTAPMGPIPKRSLESLLVPQKASPLTVPGTDQLGSGSLLKPAQGIRVRDRKTGVSGTLTDPSEFDPNLYERI